MGRLGHTPARARRVAPHHRAGPARRVALVGAAALAAVATLLLPAVAAAHPLGNFTINHYAAIRVGSDRVLVDLVIDQAEIPTFQERLDLDLDGDATVSPDEIDAGRRTECGALVPKLSLTAGGTTVPLTLRSAGLSFPPGAGGLSTMRIVCELDAPLPAPLAVDHATAITFQDGSFPERIGWREIVADGSGAAVTAVSGTLRPTSVSERLRSYPADLLTTPLDDRMLSLEATATAAAGALVPFAVTDATPLDPSAGVAAPDAVSPSTAPVTAVDPVPAVEPAAAVAGAVPGGVSGGDLPSIFRTPDLTPFVVLLSFLTAVVLGAGHALTPGHGKTLMAAYLVGTRGTATHALGLGLSVSLSHTVGILVLAAVVVGAADVLPPDLVVRAAPVVAAISIAFIGGWMLFGEWRRRRAIRAGAGTLGLAHDHDHDHDDVPGHAHPHAAIATTTTPIIRAHVEPAHATVPAGEAIVDDGHDHSHGGVRHSHLPPIGGSISWRSLFVLGLAGGLIPSTSALLILLGSIAAGRPAFGFVLVVAFGLGMAAVMTGIGLAMVVARGRLERAPAGPTLRRVRDAVPLVAAVLVFGFGIYLTAQAVAGAPTL